MSNNNKINFITISKLNYLYLFCNILAFSIIFLIITMAAFDIYNFYIKVTITNNHSHTGNLTTTLDALFKEVFLFLFWTLGKVAITLIGTLIVKYIIFHLPISSNILINLDKKEEISPIFGRFLAYHFRNNQSINLKDFIYLNKEAEYEKYMLAYHQSKNKHSYFLEKYDKYYPNDLN